MAQNGHLNYAQARQLLVQERTRQSVIVAAAFGGKADTTAANKRGSF
jgi:hypothetical protein